MDCFKFLYVIHDSIIYFLFTDWWLIYWYLCMLWFLRGCLQCEHRCLDPGESTAPVLQPLRFQPLLFSRPLEINKMDEKVGGGEGGGRGDLTIQCGRSGQKTQAWVAIERLPCQTPPASSPAPNATVWSCCCTRADLSPLRAPVGGAEAATSSRTDLSDGAAVTRRTAPPSSSPSLTFRLRLFLRSWCAFCLVPNDSCDGTVMLCDHTGRQPSPLSVLSLRSGGWVGGRGGSEGQPRRTSQSHFIAEEKISFWRSRFVSFLQK